MSWPRRSRIGPAGGGVAGRRGGGVGGRGPRGPHPTGRAAPGGVPCSGPAGARRGPCTHPRRWLPGFRPADGDAALRALVTRYLYAYGPATPQHFARWLGIPPRHAAVLFGAMPGELERVELDGEPGWTLAGDTPTPPRP